MFHRNRNSPWIVCLCSLLQFNYMHECFERIFCELKWKKEVLITYFSVVISLPFLSFVVNEFLFDMLKVEDEASDKDNKNCSNNGKKKTLLPSFYHTRTLIGFCWVYSCDDHIPNETWNTGSFLPHLLKVSSTESHVMRVMLILNRQCIKWTLHLLERLNNGNVFLYYVKQNAGNDSVAL